MNKTNKYNPGKHHRKSIRLRGYDYSQPGLYFVTICCQNRHHLFGKIEKGIMILNDAGQIANNCWLEIPKHFPNVILHSYVIMPNHVHGIIELIETNTSNVWAKIFSPIRPNGTSKTVGSIIRGFKIGVTKWMRKNTNTYNVWQRNYYEHIIRNDKSYQTITEYIMNNPINWEKDKFFTG
ncbi:MAG: hypothetical protein CSA01_00130 [Bacteroidetes bacterium]|nr:MAG: hypothetical protein CSA01_00130 [Bacteroidota bacterium]